MGRTGRFQPLDVVDIAIGHRAHPAYICNKLWGYFSPRPCPPKLLRRLAKTYRAAGTDVRPVLREILNEKLFYAGLREPDMVKPPFVYTAGMLRLTDTYVTDDSWAYRLDQMGQVPFHPPNVSGWEGGLAWLSTSSIRARFDAASAVLRKTIEDGSISAKQTPAQAVQSALAATGHLDFYDELCADLPISQQRLLKVPGIGPILAERISRDLGADDLETLLRNAARQRLEQIWGVGPVRAKAIIEVAFPEDEPPPPAAGAAVPRQDNIIYTQASLWDYHQNKPAKAA